MARDFLRFVPRPLELGRLLKRVALGGLVASTGLGAMPEAATPASIESQLTIVDRSKKAAKLILQLPGSVSSFVAQHRSHRSHSSHRSHYSSAGGGSPAPVVRPPATRPAPPVTTAVPTPAVAAVRTSGEILSVDTTNRTFVLKISEAMSRTISYRDDTKFENTTGLSIRFDDFASSTKNLVPISKSDKVELTWRVSGDGRTPIAVTITKKP